MLLTLVCLDRPNKNKTLPWEIQYNDGLNNQLLTYPTNSNFKGYSFIQISCFLYMEFQVTLIGLRIHIQSGEKKGGDHVHHVLNPGSSYVFRGNEEMLIVGQSLEEIKMISELNKAQVDAGMKPVLTQIPLNSNLNHSDERRPSHDFSTVVSLCLIHLRFCISENYML
jgi:hypothetical protein